MTNLSTILDTVAAKTNLPFETVKTVIFEFFDQVWGHLRAREKVVLIRIGTFRLHEGISRRTGGPSIFPKFKIAGSARSKFFDPANLPPITDMPEERNPMEKYGVKLDEDKKLAARLSGKCPDCKAQLESINPPVCPTCGTAPFEPTPPPPQAA